MIEGYIPLKRKFFEHKIWQEKREFSRAEAWIDLLQSACYKPEGQGRFIDNQYFKESRGEFIASQRYLQTRWGWKSKTKVENFLKWLESEKMIMVKKCQKISQITICKYDTYNPQKASQKPVESQSKAKSNKEINTSVVVAGNAHLFSESPYANNLPLFKQQFDPKQYRTFDLDYYYNLLKAKSESREYRYPDWIKAAKDWMLQDYKKGVLKQIEPKPYSPQTQEEQDDLFGGRNPNFKPKVAA